MGKVISTRRAVEVAESAMSAFRALVEAAVMELDTSQLVNAQELSIAIDAVPLEDIAGDGTEARATFQRLLEEAMGGVGVITIPMPAPLDEAMDAAAFAQKTARGALGGKVTKAAAQRSADNARAKAADKVEAAKARSWIDEKLDEAHARAKAAAAQGGLKTGDLTPTQIVYRVRKNFRKR